MNKYLAMIAGIIGLVVIVLISGMAYNSLRKKQEMAKNAPPEMKKNSDYSFGAGVSNPAEDFKVSNEKGQDVRLSSLGGKPIVLNFWASWCGPCKSEMPEFQKAFDKYGSEVTFMMVNLTDGGRETKLSAQEFVSSNGYTFPVYFDTEQSAATAYGISAIPTTYFIDAKGGIVSNRKGTIDGASLDSAIQETMSN